MKKILIVVDERKKGGVSNVLKNIINALPELKFDILVLHNNGDDLSDLKNANLIFGNNFFEVVDIPLKQVLLSKKLSLIIKKIYMIFLLKTGLIKYKIIKERKKILFQQYDIEISFKDGFGTFFVAYGDSKLKYKWLHADYSNNNPGRHYKKSYYDATQKYDKIIAISQSVGEKFNQIYKLSDKTIVINNLVNTNLPKKDKKIINNKLQFVTIGRLNYIKGYDRLIETVHRLDSEQLFDNAILSIVGDGEEKNKLEKMITEYKLENKVQLLGYISNPWNKIKNGDIFVMCSYSEAYPLTVIESQLVNIPVFALEYSSVYEMINPNHGIIAKNTNDSLYFGLKEIINNPKLVQKLQKEIKNYVYDNKKIIEKIERIFN